MSATRILVVDDESDIRSTLKEVLTDEGHDVDVAADATQARAARTRHEPDLVLLDIWMPDTDGITLLREWSSQGALRCPVVIMSGHGTVETAVEATRLGAFDFVEKPLSLAKLLPIDLHPRAFAPGDTALTAAGQVGVQIWQRDVPADTGPTYELVVFRSYAAAMWQWLTRAAAEFNAESN